MICNIRSLKSPIKRRSFSEEIITSSNEVFKDFATDMTVGMRMLGIPTRETAENHYKVKPTAGS